MSIVPGSAPRVSAVLRVRAAIVCSPGLRAIGLASCVAASGCGGAPATDASAEILERLDRIETRLAAIERQRATPEDRESRERTDTPRATTDTAHRDEPPSLADPFARPEPPTGTSLAVAVTRAGWQVQGRTVNEAQLKALLSGVGSVTVRADDGASHQQVVTLIDLLHEAEIQRIAIARFSDQSVEPAGAAP
jgi:biopolymer transport protein ExbD